MLKPDALQIVASAKKQDWFAQIFANALIQIILATIQPLQKMVKMKMISHSPAPKMKIKTLFALLFNVYVVNIV